jgi:hypothetical protein
MSGIQDEDGDDRKPDDRPWQRSSLTRDLDVFGRDVGETVQETPREGKIIFGERTQSYNVTP